MKVVNEMYSFKGLINESELKALMQLNQQNNGKIDFMNADEQEVKQFINGLQFDQPPESNLIVKKSIIKRESGPFNTFKECTAIFTRDK